VRVAAAAVAVVAAVIALLLAVGGDDEDSTTKGVSSTSSTTIVETLPPEGQIELNAGLWARHFAAAADDAACELMASQPACERLACESVSGPVENCTPPSARFRKSFENAIVQDIVIKGNRAAAKFSNGEAVELEHATGVGEDDWGIAKFGGIAGRKFFK
jgi:hypothetical protein